MSDVCLVNVALDTRRAEASMPLGCLSLAAFLEASGWSVELRDLQLAPPAVWESPQGLAGAVETDAPVLGVSVMADRLPDALAALRVVKDRAPEKVVVLGGAGPTGVALPLLRAYPFVDAVVLGEGEETLAELLPALRAGGRMSGIPGTAARAGGDVVLGPPRTRIDDLDALPWPESCRWDILPYAEASLVTARGCPFACSFCSVQSAFGRRTGVRSIPRVMDELAWLRIAKPGAFVHFEDDTFTLDRERVLAVCDGIGRRFSDAAWGCTARVERLDEEIVRRMAGAGCRSMFLGIESGSDAVRARLGKHFTARQAVAAVEMVLRHIGRVVCHFIWGFPFEALSDFHETFLLLSYLDGIGASARHSHLVPFPGSPLVAEHGAKLAYREHYPFPRLFLADPGSAAAEAVRAHPEVFVPWLELETPDMEAKADFVQRFERFATAR